MRQSKFTETQIVYILKEADAGLPLNEIWRSCGISSAIAGGHTARAAAQSGGVGRMLGAPHRVAPARRHPGARPGNE